MAYIPPLNGGRLNATISGNTAGAGSLVSTGTLSLAGGNNITLSQNGNAITISAANAPAGSVNFSAGTTSGNLASVTFANSNGIGFGLNGGTITASHNGITSQTNQTLGLYAGSNTTLGTSGSLDARSLSMNAYGGMSIGYTNSSIALSAPAVSSVMATGILNIFNNGNTISLGVPAFSAGMSSSAGNSTTFGNTAGTAGIATNQLLLAGGNNITLSQATGGGGNTLSIIGASQTVQTQNLIQGIVGGAATSTASSGTVTFANSNGVSFGMSGNSMTASVAAAAGGVAISGGGTSYSSGTVNLSAAGGALTIASGANQSLNFSVPATSSLSGTGAISISTAGGTISIGAPLQSAQTQNVHNLTLAGNTAGLMTQVSSGTLTLAGGNNITLSQAGNAITISGAGGGPAISAAGNSISNGTAVFSNANGHTFGMNASTITVSAGIHSGTLSRFEYPDGVWGTIGTIPQGSLSLQHMYVPFNVIGSQMKIGGSLSINSFTSATTASVNLSVWMGIYTLNGSTLSLASSGSANNGFTWGNTAQAGTYASSIVGMRQLTVPMNITLRPGEYWAAAAVSSASTFTGIPAFTLYGDNVMASSLDNLNILSPIGVNSTVASNQRDVMLFEGIYTAVTSAGPLAIQGSQINNTGSSAMLAANFYNAIINAVY